MDHFMEEAVAKKNRTLPTLLYFFATVLMIVTALLGLLSVQVLLYQFSVLALVETLVLLGIAALLFLRRDRLRTEYEYTFTNGELDFAMVFNNKKRKSLGTMRVKNVEAFGPVNTNPFRKLINMPGLNKRNWFLNRDAQLYYFYYQKDGAKNIIVFEPSEALVVMIRKYLSQGVYQE